MFAWIRRSICSGLVAGAAIALFGPTILTAQTAPGAAGSQVTIITKAEIRRRNVARLDELFQGLVPGIAATEGVGPRASIMARGRTTADRAGSVAVYVDGIRLEDPTMMSSINPEFVEKIEVRTGTAGAALSDFGASGGAIYITTLRAAAAKQGQPARAAVLSGLVSGGSETSLYGNDKTTLQRHALNLSGALPAFEYALAGGYFSQGNFAPNSAAHATDGMARMSTTMGKLTIAATGMAWTGAYDLPDTRRPSSSTALPWDIDQDARHYSAGVRLVWDAKSKFRQTLHYGVDRSIDTITAWSPYVITSPNRALIEDGLVGRQTSYGYTMAYDLTDGAAKATLTLGYERVNHVIKASYDSSVVDAATSARMATYQSYREMSLKSDAYFGAIDMTFGDLLLSVGARHDGMKYPMAMKPSKKLLPRVGAGYTWKASSATVVLRSAYGVTNQQPNELGLQAYSYNPSMDPSTYVSELTGMVKPVEVRGQEVGADVTLANGPTIGVTLFDQKSKNVASPAVVDSVPLTYLPTGSTFWAGQYQYNSVASLVTTGVEFTARWTLGALDLRGVYSTARTKVDEVPAEYLGYTKDSVYSDAPRTTAGFEVAYNGAPLRISLETRYWGSYRNRTYLELATPVPVQMNYPAFAIYNLNLARPVTPMFEIVGAVQNLTNVERYNATNAGYARGRRTSIGARIRY